MQKCWTKRNIIVKLWYALLNSVNRCMFDERWRVLDFNRSKNVGPFELSKHDWVENEKKPLVDPIVFAVTDPEKAVCIQSKLRFF